MVIYKMFMKKSMLSDSWETRDVRRVERRKATDSRFDRTNHFLLLLSIPLIPSVFFLLCLSFSFIASIASIASILISLVKMIGSNIYTQRKSFVAAAQRIDSTRTGRKNIPPPLDFVRVLRSLLHRNRRQICALYCIRVTRTMTWIRLESFKVQDNRSWLSCISLAKTLITGCDVTLSVAAASFASVWSTNVATNLSSNWKRSRLRNQTQRLFSQEPHAVIACIRFSLMGVG